MAVIFSKFRMDEKEVHERGITTNRIVKKSIRMIWLNSLYLY